MLHSLLEHIANPVFSVKNAIDDAAQPIISDPMPVIPYACCVFMVASAALVYLDSQYKKARPKNCIKAANLIPLTNHFQDDSSLETLPDELKLKIATYLTAKDIAILKLLNRQWYWVCQDIAIKEKIVLEKIPKPIIEIFGTAKTIAQLPRFQLNDERAQDVGDISIEPSNHPMKSLVFPPLNKKQGINQEKEWFDSLRQKPHLNSQNPPSFWPKIKLKGSASPLGSPLITFIRPPDLKGKSIILFLDSAKRWSFAFRYTCTYQADPNGPKKTIEGVATLHQAYASKDAPWIWIDNVDIKMSWKIQNPEEAIILETDKYAPQDHPKRWFLFFHSAQAPDWPIHAAWLRKFLTGDRCLWLREGQLYRFATIQLSQERKK